MWRGGSYRQLSLLPLYISFSALAICPSRTPSSASLPSPPSCTTSLRPPVQLPSSSFLPFVMPTALKTRAPSNKAHHTTGMANRLRPAAVQLHTPTSTEEQGSGLRKFLSVGRAVMGRSLEALRPSFSSSRRMTGKRPRHGHGHGHGWRPHEKKVRATLHVSSAIRLEYPHSLSYQA